MGEKGETDLPDPTPALDATGAPSRLRFEGGINLALLLALLRAGVV